jgi:hypothetical protein
MRHLPHLVIGSTAKTVVYRRLRQTQRPCKGSFCYTFVGKPRFPHGPHPSRCAAASAKPRFARSARQARGCLCRCATTFKAYTQSMDDSDAEMPREQLKEDSLLFYQDETVVELAGKKHLLIASIHFRYPYTVAHEILELKKRLGLQKTDELKWHQEKLTTKELRIACQEGVLKELNLGVVEVLVSVTEGLDKQVAARQAATQVSCFTKDYGAKSFSIFADKDLIPDIQSLWLELNENDSGPRCINLQELESSRDLHIQITDIFAGVYKTILEKTDRGDAKKVPISNDEGEGEYLPLNHLLIINTRWLLWGEYYEDKVIDAPAPFKDTWGKGLLITSSIPAASLENLHEQAAKTYMGCMH